LCTPVAKYCAFLIAKNCVVLFTDYNFAGKTMDYIDPVSGEVIACKIFVACFPYSGYSYVCALRSQSVEDFIYALSCCLDIPEHTAPPTGKKQPNKSGVKA
jgi:hypothetical protein